MVEEDLFIRVPENFLSRKIQRVWLDAVVYKRTDGNRIDYVIERPDQDLIHLNDPTRKVRGGPFIEASTNINALVRAERARAAAKPTP